MSEQPHTQPRKNDLDRVREFFREHHFEFDETDNPYTLVTAFAGVRFEIRHVEPNIALVSTVAVEKLGADRFMQVLEWVENYNSTHAFPSTVALRDERRDLAALGATFVIPGTWEYTDTQFTDWLSSGIHGIVDAATEFFADFSSDEQGR